MSRALPRRLAYLREWLLLAALLLGLTALVSGRASLPRLDYLVQDLGTRLLAPAARTDIVLVAIDDRSIAAIGRWPWRRALHAELIGRISAQQPRAIGLDVLLGEEDLEYPQDDLLLARAIARSARVVLPVARRAQADLAAPDLPLPAFAAAAAELGHVQVQVGSDGVARGIYQLEGPADAPWPHLSRALRCAAGEPDPACRGHVEAGVGPWVRLQPRQLAFARGEPAFASHSYIDVLTGRVAPDAFAGKYVLIGATATGLGDHYAIPPGAGASRIAGVQLLAHALNTELSGRGSISAGTAATLALNLAAVTAALVGLWLFGPLGSLLACIALAGLTLTLALLAPALWGLQWSPSGALVGIAAAYPLWSWRRLSFAARFLQRELAALHREGLALHAEDTAHRLGADRLGQRIHAVEAATRQLRSLHHYIADSLKHLPSPTFVCDAAGRITLATQAADVFASDARPLLREALTQVLANLVHPLSGAPLLASWPPHAEHLHKPQEGRDARGRRWLMLTSTFAQAEQQHWLITLVDLTEMRQAQEQRDQALRFISHDLRSPASAILTLLEMQRSLPEPLAEAQLQARIARHARALLTMAEDFTELASAQTQKLRRETLDLVALLHDAVQQSWAQAQARGVQVRIVRAPAQAPCEGDRHMLTRAIANLLNNAIKYTAAHTEVECAITELQGCWQIGVRDHGPGIAPEQHQRIFKAFERLHAPGASPGEGFGLGLAFVQEAMRRHAGAARVRSDGQNGSEFLLLLPMAPAAGAPAISD
ncbi:CHASE2 domain-containing protein [Comamonas sp. NLF-1-9]|uniref:CHASE2 domain-containing protein n=1 Tax=Comamonas sp. NLF-1-9 TaxID=2853163 RepID=UPI001C487E29|nr:CHASE2 domain-containing protein [Comamonas sp. NLF-1-9]QXL83331.1 CHASE2 domain-containing protein [Comamonas sp. NLF-1-9]